MELQKGDIVECVHVYRKVPFNQPSMVRGKLVHVGDKGIVVSATGNWYTIQFPDSWQSSIEPHNWMKKFRKVY